MRAFQSLFRKQPPPVLPGEGERPAYRDTLSAIHDLSRLVRNDPEAIDIYLALGNLFRAQGDIERSVVIREGLIARRNLNNSFKARAYFELGQDYHRAGFVDRALAAFRSAAQLGYPEDAVTAELANLYASSGDFAQAALEYGRLNHSLAQAHYLVRQAMELTESGEEARAQKLLKRALKIYPGAVEAWNANIRMALRENDLRKMAAFLERGLGRVARHLRFLLLDTLLESLPELPYENPDTDGDLARSVCALAIPAMEKQEPGTLLHYYGALLLQRAGDMHAMEAWLSRALVVQPDFWAARLLYLTLAVQKHELPPVVGLQVSGLADELRHIRRFSCAVCGFRENQVFYRCRRCGSWHSLTFRLSLQQ